MTHFKFQRLWHPWISETKHTIMVSARWIFAALILSVLILSNVLAVVCILRVLKKIIE